MLCVVCACCVGVRCVYTECGVCVLCVVCVCVGVGCVCVGVGCVCVYVYTVWCVCRGVCVCDVCGVSFDLFPTPFPLPLLRLPSGWAAARHGVSSVGLGLPPGG